MAKTKSSVRGKQNKKIVVVKPYTKADGTKVSEHRRSTPNWFWCTIFTKGDIVMYKTGQKPGKGTYRCVSCGQIVILDDHTDTLPPCPNCDAVYYYKVG